MGFLSGMDISASGLTAQRLRMDVISENIANIDTTRTEEGGPYTRKYVVMEEREASFSQTLKNASEAVGAGVRVSEIGEDSSEYQRVYDPDHPEADEDGYVAYPNVQVTQEMVDMLSAYRAYEANITAFGAYKSMAVKTLEIGT
ncbi:MAG TPA: flagellar basal body rod protein FlgC [Clostridiales bacterium]|jgi:flagellar basal-body rod protein FlgC|nr:flagellar basal body rod protein FlgC [Clostridiales bacterium]